MPPPKPPIRILYEDNHLLAIEKPPGLLSQGDATGDADVLSVVKAFIKERDAKPGNVFLGLVHRLDRPVGGAMILAKTSKGAARLSEQIRAGRFEKRYWAVVRGALRVGRRRLEHWLRKDGGANRVSVVAEGDAGAKRAVLELDVVATAGDLSLVWVNLLTGRPHQIRVQLAAIGHPIYGDRRYAPERGAAGEALGLWSARLRCAHPTRDGMLSVSSVPPASEPWTPFREQLQGESEWTPA